jgi:hypothetical protein
VIDGRSLAEGRTGGAAMGCRAVRPAVAVALGRPGALDRVVDALVRHQLVERGESGTRRPADQQVPAAQFGLVHRAN